MARALHVRACMRPLLLLLALLGTPSLAHGAPPRKPVTDGTLPDHEVAKMQKRLEARLAFAAAVLEPMAHPDLRRWVAHQSQRTDHHTKIHLSNPAGVLWEFRHDGKGNAWSTEPPFGHVSEVVDRFEALGLRTLEDFETFLGRKVMEAAGLPPKSPAKSSLEDARRVLDEALQPAELGRTRAAPWRWASLHDGVGDGFVLRASSRPAFDETFRRLAARRATERLDDEELRRYVSAQIWTRDQMIQPLEGRSRAAQLLVDVRSTLRGHHDSDSSSSLALLRRGADTLTLKTAYPDTHYVLLNGKPPTAAGLRALGVHSIADFDAIVRRAAIEHIAPEDIQ